MKCPLCQLRKPKRFCPAKGAEICAACCGSKREVEIDCPADCPYLQQGREYESQKLVQSGQVAEFTPRLWEANFVDQHHPILNVLAGLIVQERARFPEMVDSDVQETLNALLQTYETLDRGIYYESRPTAVIQNVVFKSLKAFFEEAGNNIDTLIPRLTTRTILDCLQFLKEMGASLVLPRPKSRAFLDRLETIQAAAVANYEPARIVMP